MMDNSPVPDSQLLEEAVEALKWLSRQPGVSAGESTDAIHAVVAALKPFQDWSLDKMARATIKKQAI
jgi:hypothetical protein